MRKQTALSLAVLLLCLPALDPSVRAADDPYAGKKLVQYGWGTPDTAFLREHVREIEKTPFDGVVIEVKSKTKGDVLGWRTFSKTRFAPEELEQAIADLKATKFERLTDNFIQMIGQPAEVDWFDPDWSAIAHNAACLARVAKLGGCKGLMLDPEDYGSNHIWNYGAWPERVRLAHSFAECVAKIKERGKEFIRAINREYPDITILSLLGPSLSYSDYEHGAQRQGGWYGLLYAFFDGMCEAAAPETVIVDGYEQSYAFRDRARFQDCRKRILELTRDTLSTNPAAYKKHIAAGFGVWADNDSGSTGWHPDDFSKNYFTPAGFRASLAYALEASDEYVWVYSQAFRWWAPTSVPAEYVEALDLAKKGPGQGEKNPLKID